MQGKIKMFNQTKAFGFIIGEDNNDYFFHATSIQSDDYPAIGMTVEFVPSENTKGLVAKEVKISGSIKTNRPVFFCCGKDRIRLSNIKDYRISMVKCAYISVFDAVTRQECCKLPVYWDHGHNDGAEFFDEVNNKNIVNDYGMILRTSDGRITFQEEGEDMREYRIWKSTECLVITTYQGDTFEYFGEIESRSGNDIYEKLKELDSYFI